MGSCPDTDIDPVPLRAYRPRLTGFMDHPFSLKELYAG